MWGLYQAWIDEARTMLYNDIRVAGYEKGDVYMDQTKTGALIRSLRIKKQMTQKALAERLNVSDKAVSKWECGKGCPCSRIFSGQMCLRCFRAR